jgi:fermentation-respiration switch protein FrsA (DUF1100 family)
MAANARAMKAVPIFMAVGKNDRIVGRARSQYFQPAAKNNKSNYIEINGGHMDTPNKVKAEVVAWLSAL